MAQKKRPNPKKDKSARRRRPDRPRPGTFTAGFLDASRRAGLNSPSLQASHGPPQAVIPVLLTTTWAGAQIGQQANHCVDACRTLGFALAQLGVRTELRAVDLTVHNNRTKKIVQHASATPSWNGNELNGHCILTLPDEDRYIDATIEQLPEVAALKIGPAVGRSGGYLSPDTGAISAASATARRMPEGSQIALMRGHLTMLYTLASDEANQIITGSTVVRTYADQHRRAGVNLVSVILTGLRDRLPDLVRQIPYPRLTALLEAIGDSPYTVADNGDVQFTVTSGGVTRELLLDELPLPAGIPPEVPLA